MFLKQGFFRDFFRNNGFWKQRFYFGAIAPIFFEVFFLVFFYRFLSFFKGLKDHIRFWNSKTVELNLITILRTLERTRFPARAGVRPHYVRRSVSSASRSARPLRRPESRSVKRRATLGGHLGSSALGPLMRVIE